MREIGRTAGTLGSPYHTLLWSMIAVKMYKGAADLEQQNFCVLIRFNGVHGMVPVPSKIGRFLVDIFGDMIRSACWQDGGTACFEDMVGV